VIDVVNRALTYAKALLQRDSSGHDFHHVLRVVKLSLKIAEGEPGTDRELVGLIAALHDVDDRKLFPETCATLGNARSFLEDNGVPSDRTEIILQGIGQISFKGSDSTAPDTPEARCVQDADRLDAMGAIGIGRAFAFGGSRGRSMYDPDQPPKLHMDGETYAKTQGPTINHFYEKLLLLKDMMNTETGKAMAAHRHGYMEQFLEEFYAEWEGAL
jgi:uncharacterized protein